MIYKYIIKVSSCFLQEESCFHHLFQLLVLLGDDMCFLVKGTATSSRWPQPGHLQSSPGAILHPTSAFSSSPPQFVTATPSSSLPDYLEPDVISPTSEPSYLCIVTFSSHSYLMFLLYTLLAQGGYVSRLLVHT